MRFRIMVLAAAVTTGWTCWAGLSPADEGQGQAAGKGGYAAEERVTGDGDVATPTDATVAFQWAYFGQKGGYHLNGRDGYLIARNNGVCLATKMRLVGVSSQFWVYEVLGYTEGGQKVYHRFGRNLHVDHYDVNVRLGTGPWTMFDVAQRCSNSATP